MQQSLLKKNFYGRRKGKSLSKSKDSLIVNDLNKVKFTQDMLDPDKKHWLEIGFGGGEHITQQALANKDIQFIGAEPFINGVASLLQHIKQHNITNIAIWDDDVTTLMDKLPLQCIEQTFLLFPDPWPKLRHHKRRFVNATTITSLAKIMKIGATLTIASDHQEYIAWIIEHMRKQMYFDAQFDYSSPPTLPPQNWYQTRYEQKALNQNIRCTYMQFTRNSSTAI